MTTRERDTVAALGQAIARRITPKRYQLWFTPNTRLRMEEGQVVVGVANLFLQEYLQTKFGDAVLAAAAEVLGQAVPVRFTIDPDLFQAARKEQAGLPLPSADPAASSPAVDRPGPAPGRKPAARRWRRLDEFVVGPCNRLAHAAAQAVIEAPGQGGNPVVLHGPVGTGKTHLLEGACVGLRAAHPHWQIRFVAAEEFTNRFLLAMRQSKLGSFRKHYRDCDALLLDDLDFLAGKRATLEEFLHTAESLLAGSKLLVVTTDCHPRLNDDFPPELTDRLLGGGIWGLEPPDAATRLALLRSKVGPGGPAIPDDVLRHVASQLQGNVRELEGALHSLRHFARVHNRSIDIDLARQVLVSLLRHSVRVVQLADVDRAVCRALGLTDGALQARQRVWAISHPRMLAMFLARKHTAAAYSEIGRHFGNRNHSTAVAAERKVRQWLQKDEDLVLGDQRLRVRDVLERIERELRR